MIENTLLKLLIVEDELNIRNLLRSIVNWESIGIRVVGEASTGLEALHLTEELLPDIVLADIEMPYMDGLVLSRRILERYNDIMVIILSAHDLFEYAQQALKIGVSNYLLKPVDKGNLEQAMTRAVKQIKDKRALLTKMENSLIYMKNHLRFFRDRSLEELIHNGFNGELADILEIVGVNFGPDSRYTLALINIVENVEDSFAAKKYFIINNCKSYIEEYYAGSGLLYVFADGMDTITILSHKAETDLSDICRQITMSLGNNPTYRIYCGVSDVCGDLNQLPVVYMQAKDVLRLAIISEKSVVYTHPDIFPSLSRRDLEERMPDLLLFIKSGLRDEAVQMSVSLLRSAVSLQNGDLNAAKIFAFNVLSGAVNALTNQNIPWLTLITLVFPAYEQFMTIISFSEVEVLLSEQVAALSELAENHRRQESNEIVSKVIRHLEEHFSDFELSLTSMARKYACNSSYLSRAFKAYTGKSFSEYLISLRIQKAKEILVRNDYKAYQLAQEVGIPDPGYFTKCFKKATGVNFQAYKSERKK